DQHLALRTGRFAGRATRVITSRHYTQPGMISIDGGRMTAATRPSTSSGQAIRHVVEVGQFDRAAVEALFAAADRMRDLPRGAAPAPAHPPATFFTDPPPRPRLSFESAMLRLGGGVISTENARDFSSTIKGESVEDTVRIVAGYADAIVIRHYEQGAARRAAA